jgi:hypothetical protein
MQEINACNEAKGDPDTEVNVFVHGFAGGWGSGSQ